ncbi:hypothetical protein N3K66_003446 [Trichothecium roseum]|uniref:Uncharacterized protein n=1 Tax=Trichothecium roseum TaxID=47278 RepID=A0ACC0V5D5_9HYPO|nr:hypothetical protein N3K66_003446 [Trichothecium roseum]
MPLFEMPTEILSLIVEHLPVKDLCSVARASKRLSGVIETPLYRSIEVKWNVRNPCPIATLLATLLKRPQLARKVRNFVCRGNDYCPCGRIICKGRPPPVKISVEQISTFEHAAGRYGVYFREYWIHQLRAREIDAVFALLLAQLKGLRSLTLDANFGPRWQSLTGEVIRLSICDRPTGGNKKLPKFDQLRKVRFLGANPAGRTSYAARDALPFILAPQIEEFQAPLHVCTLLRRSFTGCSATSSLTSLTLGSFVEEDKLAEVLAMAPNVKSLNWAWSPTARNWGMNFTELLKSLSLVRDTLMELRIVTMIPECNEFQPYTPLDFKGDLSGLVDFNLTKLQLPMEVLLDNFIRLETPLHEIIPQTTEVLKVIEDRLIQARQILPDDKVFSALIRFVRSVPYSHPSLRHLMLEEMFDQDEDRDEVLGDVDFRDEDIWTTIREECQEVGFECSYIEQEIRNVFAGDTMDW